MSEESRPVHQEELSAKPRTKEDEFFEKQERERLEELERLKNRKSRTKVMDCAECDGTELVTEKIGGLDIDRCPICKGVWLDPGEFETLTSAQAKEKDGPIMSFFKSIAGRD